MKHWNRTLPAKVVCFVLCILSITVTAACVIGAIAFSNLELYSYSESYLIDAYNRQAIHDDAYNLVFNHVNDYFGGYKLLPENTNLRYKLVSHTGETLDTNLPDGENPGSDAWKYRFVYETSVLSSNMIDVSYIGSETAVTGEDTYTLYAYLMDDLPIDDEYARMNTLISLACSVRYAILPIGVLALVLSLICFIILMVSSARRPGSDELHPGAFDPIPFDLLLGAVIFLFCCAVLLITDYWYSGELLEYVLLFVLGFASLNVFLGLCMSIAARIKTRTIFTNTLICIVGKFVLHLAWRIVKGVFSILSKIARGIHQLIVSIPMIWRTIVLTAFLTVFDFFLIVIALNGGEAVLLLWIPKTLCISLAVLYAAVFMRKLQKGGNALAKGDLSYKTDTSMMFWDFKRHGENLNSIADGMASAVEQRIRSERMKTELITNVSHDIKTPLTSIINYSTLIAEEECDSEKHREYAEVLVRKSEHLKRLLDDLVETSKASSGNLEISLAPCDAVVLLTQAAGEFEQRCAAADLELITACPEQSVQIMADSRRIWRVFENLMSNACQYSLPHSRVYLTLEVRGEEALFIFRNTSRTALNISPDELMERFVRGDTARTTEGNGLGLSIARSLTELQNGRFDITIDGDLFKVVVGFKCV